MLHDHIVDIAWHGLWNLKNCIVSLEQIENYFKKPTGDLEHSYFMENFDMLGYI